MYYFNWRYAIYKILTSYNMIWKRFKNPLIKDSYWFWLFDNHFENNWSNLESKHCPGGYGFLMQLSNQYLWILYFWKGLLSQCTRARAKQEVVLFVHDRMDCDNKTQQIGLNRNYNMTFFISLRECWHSIFKRRMNILFETRTTSRANLAC